MSSSSGLRDDETGNNPSIPNEPAISNEPEVIIEVAYGGLLDSEIAWNIVMNSFAIQGIDSTPPTIAIPPRLPTPGREVRQVMQEINGMRQAIETSTSDPSTSLHPNQSAMTADESQMTHPIPGDILSWVNFVLYIHRREWVEPVRQPLGNSGSSQHVGHQQNNQPIERPRVRRVLPFRNISEERQQAAIAHVRALRPEWANLEPAELADAFQRILVREMAGVGDRLPLEESENQPPLALAWNFFVPRPNMVSLSNPPPSTPILTNTFGPTPSDPQRPWGLDVPPIENTPAAITQFARILGHYHTTMARPTPAPSTLHSQPHPRRAQVTHPAITARNRHTGAAPRRRGSNNSHPHNQLRPFSRDMQDLLQSQRLVEAQLRRSFQPAPLSRAELEQYAQSLALNPAGLTWYDLSFIAHIQNRRESLSCRVRELVNGQLLRLRAEIEGQIRDAEAVQSMVTNLALCNSVTDSAPFLATVDIDGSTDISIRDPVMGIQRPRAWIPSSQILTPRERTNLLAALVRRYNLGRWMGLLSYFASEFGEETGQRYFDYWVAQAVTSVVVTNENGYPAGEGSDSAGALWAYVAPLFAPVGTGVSTRGRSSIRNYEDTARDQPINRWGMPVAEGGIDEMVARDRLPIRSVTYPVLGEGDESSLSPGNNDDLLSYSDDAGYDDEFDDIDEYDDDETDSNEQTDANEETDSSDFSPDHVPSPCGEGEVSAPFYIDLEPIESLFVQTPPPSRAYHSPSLSPALTPATSTPSRTAEISSGAHIVADADAETHDQDQE